MRAGGAAFAVSPALFGLRILLYGAIIKFHGLVKIAKGKGAFGKTNVDAAYYKSDRRQRVQGDAAVCPADLHQQPVSAAVQCRRLADRGQFSGRRGAGGGRLLRQPDFSADGLCQRRVAGRGRCGGAVFRRQGLEAPAQHDPHHGGAGACGGRGADGGGRAADPADPALDGYARKRLGQLGGVFPHLLFRLHCGGDVQCGRQHFAVGRRQPQPYAVSDYGVHYQHCAGYYFGRRYADGCRRGGICDHCQPVGQRRAGVCQADALAGSVGGPLEGSPL